MKNYWSDKEKIFVVDCKGNRKEVLFTDSFYDKELPVIVKYNRKKRVIFSKTLEDIDQIKEQLFSENSCIVFESIKKIPEIETYMLEYQLPHYSSFVEALTRKSEASNGETEST